MTRVRPADALRLALGAVALAAPGTVLAATGTLDLRERTR